MDTHTAIGWRMGYQHKISQYIVIEDMVFNIEDGVGQEPIVFLTCGTDAEAIHEYAVQLTIIDENAGLSLKGHVRSAEVTIDLDALMETYIGGATPMGEDLEDVLTALANGTVVD